jgi:aspartate aminotransferase-like enzyme
LSGEKKQLVMLPGPTNVPDRVMQAMLKPMINHRGPEFHALHESIAENLKYVFQTKGDVFPLTASGTGGVECAVNNTISPGDKVIAPVFGSFSGRLKEKIVRRGGKAINLPLKLGEGPTAEQIARAVDEEKDVKAIAVLYNETSTGVTVRDIPKIGEIARKKDILFIVDAVSILGGDYLPVDEWGVDICIAGSQKCLACPPGLSMVSVSEKAWKIIEETARPYYFDLVQFREFSRKKEIPQTPALSLFYALDEALKMVREEGLENRIKRHATCANAFRAAMKALKLTLFPKEKFLSNTVIAVNVPTGVDNSRVIEIMREKYGVVITGGMDELKKSILRIGCMGIISEAEVLITINALEKALKEAGYPTEMGAGIEAAREIFHS